MKKTMLLLVPFFVGLALMVWSWYLTYPISVASADDFVFNHISILYWFSLPLLFTSMFLMALAAKSNFVKWILSVGIVLTFFSLFYFYFMMPTGDSQYFRGLTEYFIQTKSLDASQLTHHYYQWPTFFILADILTSVSGLSLANYEFLLITIIGLLLATALYVYASKKHEMAGFVTVAAFFVSVTYFIDYQSVPFTLALGLLFLLFMLDFMLKNQQNNTGLIITMIVLYASLLITHLFVPLFFVLYLLIRSLFDRNSEDKRQHRDLFLLALVSYFLVQLTLAVFSFGQLVLSFFTRAPADYSQIISKTTAAAVPNSISFIAQFFSRTVTIAAVLTCAAGLFFLLAKRKLNASDKAILLTGIVYSGLGAVLNTLGWRAIAVLFIPFSLGAAFLFKGRFRRYFAGLFLVLLILFLFVPLHSSFNTEIKFQTRENYMADNFFIEHYNLEKPGLKIVSDFRTNTYLESKLNVTVYIQYWLQPGEEADAILYTPELTGQDPGNYSSMENLSQGEKLNVLYSDGFSFVLIKP